MTFYGYGFNPVLLGTLFQQWTWIASWNLSKLPCKPVMQNIIPRYACDNFQIQTLLLLVYVVPHLLCMFIQRFAAVIMRIREPKTTALIFASGKMVSYLLLKVMLTDGCILAVAFNVCYMDLLYYQWFQWMLLEMEHCDMSVV